MHFVFFCAAAAATAAAGSGEHLCDCCTITKSLTPCPTGLHGNKLGDGTRVNALEKPARLIVSSLSVMCVCVGEKEERHMAAASPSDNRSVKALCSACVFVLRKPGAYLIVFYCKKKTKNCGKHVFSLPSDFPRESPPTIP